MWQVRKPARNLPKPAEGEEQLSAEQHRLVTVGDAGAFAKRDGHTDLKLELHQSLLDLINLRRWIGCLAHRSRRKSATLFANSWASKIRR